MVHSCEKNHVLKLGREEQRVAKHRVGYEHFDVVLSGAFTKSKNFLLTIALVHVPQNVIRSPKIGCFAATQKSSGPVRCGTKSLARCSASAFC